MKLLLIGETGVGKTHYGAQLLVRLRLQQGVLRMQSAPTNITAFEAALQALNQGSAAQHTGSGVYAESYWPILGPTGQAINLIWPDYAGEQVRNMFDARQISPEWRQRVLVSGGWLLVVRLQEINPKEDIFSRPISAIHQSAEQKKDFRVSDQARLVELLQILLYVRGIGTLRSIAAPALTILLSCWDEIGGLSSAIRPDALLRDRMPLLHQFAAANWHPDRLSIFGLSALGKPLREDGKDSEYIDLGPGHFGFVVLPDGSHSPDLTIPIADLAAMVG
jgi:hypothetical protein